MDQINDFFYASMVAKIKYVYSQPENQEWWKPWRVIRATKRFRAKGYMKLLGIAGDSWANDKREVFAAP